MKIIIFLVPFIIPYFGHGQSTVKQTGVDSIATKHLVKLKEIDSAIYSSKMEGDKQEIVTNYFLQKKRTLK